MHWRNSNIIYHYKVYNDTLNIKIHYIKCKTNNSTLHGIMMYWTWRRTSLHANSLSLSSCTYLAAYQHPKNYSEPISRRLPDGLQWHYNLNLRSILSHMSEQNLGKPCIFVLGETVQEFCHVYWQDTLWVMAE